MKNKLDYYFKKILPANDKFGYFLLIKQIVVFPGWVVNLFVEGEQDVNAVKEALKEDRQIILLFQKNKKGKDICRVGVVCRILQSWQLNESVMGLTIEGIRRVEISSPIDLDKMKKAQIKEIRKNTEESVEAEAFSRSVINLFMKVAKLDKKISPLFISDILSEKKTPDEISDLITQFIKLTYHEQIYLLECTDVKKRFEFLQNKLVTELNVLEAEQKISHRVEKVLGREQKDLILKERLKAIEEELGLSKEHEEYETIEKRIKKAKMPREVENRAFKELFRLKKLSPLAAEAPYIRTYLDCLVELPWSKKTKDKLDINKAKNILDQDHYALEEAKERVLEFLAVQKLTRGRGRGTIMCFVGPPGTGKTSVGQSIARALGREFTRISLGGIRDEAEIRGHRRTYVGALPGRIINGLRKAGYQNPVFMLDEIDKVGVDFRGDPTSALLEVLDPEQNHSFVDHYLEEPFDLSKVFFITTANILDTIPKALQDRMEVIEFPGYTEIEKFHIADKFLVERVLKNNGLRVEKLKFENNAIYKIINKYTKEAGVRELERMLSKITRKAALKIAQKETKEKIIVNEKDVIGYLGPEKYNITMREAKDEVGVATGMAWTTVGGEVIFIETTLMPGSGTLTLTGQLGEIMQESARAALSYVRSRSEELKFDKNFYKKTDIHVHVPSGAIPKDGPSAGIAIAVSLASALANRKTRKEVALSGEITLRGKVLEVGGVKEKVLAAHRSRIKTIILPKENKKDLYDIPEEVKKELKFKFVKNMDEALGVALR